MAEIYTDGTMPAAEKSGSGNTWKFFRWFIVIGSIALGIELIWFLGVTPFKPFSRIDVYGFSWYDQNSLLAFAGLTQDSSYIFTNAKETEERIASLPQIESVRVFKRFPDRLEINLSARKAAAFAFAESGGKTIPVVLDRQGVIFQIGNTGQTDAYSDFPVLSGLAIEQPALGMRLPAKFFPLLEELDAIRINAPELLSAVSEICVDKKSPEGFDITLYLLNHKIKIRLSDLNEELLRYSLLVADVLAVREPDIDLIDFRGAIASYYPKGGYL